MCFSSTKTELFLMILLLSLFLLVEDNNFRSYDRFGMIALPLLQITLIPCDWIGVLLISDHPQPSFLMSIKLTPLCVMEISISDVKEDWVVGFISVDFGRIQQNWHLQSWGWSNIGSVQSWLNFPSYNHQWLLGPSFKSTAMAEVIISKVQVLSRIRRWSCV